jgi:hypothetical protein
MRKNELAFLVLIFFFSTSTAWSQDKKADGLAMAVRMADSEIKQFPDPWTVDFNTKPVWNYTQGLIAQAMMKLWLVSKQNAYYQYAEKYALRFIAEDGSIREYKPEDFNIDAVNSGKFLFTLYENTKDERYLKAIRLLREQLRNQPRTEAGGFWHKLRYPNQMWLDGLYMGSPFYAQYAAFHKEPVLFDDVVRQFTIVHSHTWDKKTGLNYHAWARAYEMPSICNGESVGIVLFLMSLDHPDNKVIEAVQSAVKWFSDSKIYHTRIKTIPVKPEETSLRTVTTDRVVVEDPTAPPIWTRYYELETERPLFSDRNSERLYSLAEVSLERRSGYSWYTYAPKAALDKYPKWQKKWAPETNVLVK